MKRIFIPFFAAAALLASCSDWTEAEHKDFLPPMNQNDPAFLTSLRDFKVGEHLGDDDDRPGNFDRSEPAEPASDVHARQCGLPAHDRRRRPASGAVGRDRRSTFEEGYPHAQRRGLYDNPQYLGRHEGGIFRYRARGRLYGGEVRRVLQGRGPKSSLRPAPGTDSTASSSPIWAVTTAAPQLRSSWRRTRGAATIPTSYSSSADTPPSSRASRTRRFLRSVTTSSS